MVFLAAMGLASTSVAGLSAERTESIRLSDFTGQKGPLRLYGVSTRKELFLPLAETRNIKEAVLSLRLVNSIALQDQRSFLVVRFNDTTLAQVPFDSKQPISDARVRLPAELWRKGFNKLTLEVNQHYTDRCEDSTAPELWTELDFYHSHLELTHTARKSPLKLSDLSSLFSPGIGGIESVLMVTAPNSKGEVTIENGVFQKALPQVAQALALRRQYADLEIRHQVWEESWPEYLQKLSEADHKGDIRQAIPYLEQREAFHVLVATRKQLENILPASELEAIDGPQVKMQQIPALNDKKGRELVPGGVRLLVTGQTEAEVLDAALLLAEMDDSLNPVNEVSLLERIQDNADLPRASGHYLHPDRIYRFTDLGQQTTIFSDMGSQQLRLELPLPADYYALESEFLELQLDFGYGAGMGPGSVMNVQINGEYVHGLLLDNPSGSAFRNYRIKIPIRKLNPGNNTLDFEVTLRPQLVVGECAGIPGTHLIFQMLDSSSIHLPKAGSVSIQPNLALFGRTGFPYVSADYRSPTEVILASEGLVTSGLTLIGRIAQAAKAPMQELQLLVGPHQPKGHALLLGTPAQFPEDLFAKWNLALGKTQRWPYRVLNDMRQGSEENNNQSLLRGQIHQQGGLGDLGVMLGLASPYSKKPATLTLVTAETESLLQERVSTLVTSSFWSQLEGGLTVWREDPEDIVSLQVSNHYELGEKDPLMKLRLLLSNNPWYWLAGVFLALVGLTVIAVRLLRRRKAAMEREE
ncbi:cellulose biosynthesis cyclic di-GMP-binding regulatory protein BcsB [Marinospirillum sp.]|uniref:cellulose biosynthesis cyclic di-GMP-binding regulatory protein BcsB n=1 Tax=Marinospirillum sp. TaxID=2183934 RepID=UPI00287024F7|nr:cellulose biosynthesis cyclic di-GMP-binding regulatory protein BcsB [Marinospirillum sp.]MDR9468992.1 cellulose biosynthesis cyclic di-GMP-binding regulatory protein BcsB [Marinospirillum sp.]